VARQQHRVHGDARRFEVVAAFVSDRFGHSVRYVADVAGGQGLLARILTKKYNYEAEVIDPRGWVCRGVESRAVEFTAEMAGHFDLVVGLHPDEALRPVVAAAAIRPVVVVPCCNFWSDERLGSGALLDAIEASLGAERIACERVAFDFAPPKNLGLCAVPAGWRGR